MRYLLDTNILSNVTKPAPSELLLAWMAEQADEDLFIASLVVAEIWFGILDAPAGKSVFSWRSGSEARRGRKPCLPAGFSPSTRRPV